jgi:hypothetical protein
LKAQCDALNALHIKPAAISAQKKSGPVAAE